MKILTLALFLVLIAGCASAINRKTATIHTRQAQNAIAAGDWESARKHWAKAVVNAELGEIEPQARAVIYYEYGRSLGVTCFYSKSEQYLRKAYDLDKTINGPIYMSILELARLNYDQSKYKKADEYYAQLIPLLDSMNSKKKAPIEYSNILSEYSDVLLGEGMAQKSDDIKKRAKKIREDNPEGHSITDRTPYGKHCAERSA